MRLYVDTSAYLCVLLGESGHKLLMKEMAGAELFSSVLLVLEATRNLVRLSRDRLLSPAELQACLARLAEDCELFSLRDLTLDLCVGTRMPVVTTPRSLDLAHLRPCERDDDVGGRLPGFSAHTGGIILRRPC